MRWRMRGDGSSGTPRTAPWRQARPGATRWPNDRLGPGWACRRARRGRRCIEEERRRNRAEKLRRKWRRMSLARRVPPLAPVPRPAASAPERARSSTPRQVPSILSGTRPPGSAPAGHCPARSKRSAESAPTRFPGPFSVFGRPQLRPYPEVECRRRRRKRHSMRLEGLPLPSRSRLHRIPRHEASA